MFLIHQSFDRFFNPTAPLLRRKQSAFAMGDTPGLWRVHWQLGETTVLSTFYTRIDQACLLWGLIAAAIFITAQFTLLDWGTQALVWSGLSIVGTVLMVQLSRHVMVVEPLKQVILAWAALVAIGLLITDFSIFASWGPVVAGLCPLWLGISALGYLYTGFVMRSRAFLLTSLLHLLGIAILPWVGVWQFLTTGLMIGLSVVMLAEFQWDSDGICAHHANANAPMAEPILVEHS